MAKILVLYHSMYGHVETMAMLLGVLLASFSCVFISPDG